MRRWVRLASLGLVLVLVLALSAYADDSGGIIPPGEEIVTSAKGDPPPDTGPFPKNRQDEPSVALNPTDPKKLSMGFNDWSREPSCTNTTPSDCSARAGISLSGIARSINGGESFTGAGNCRGSVELSPPNSGGPFAFGDPALAYDSKGNLYYGTIGFPGTSASDLKNGDFFVAKFTDGTCKNTSFANVSGNVKFDDKDAIAVDINPNSPCRDTVYGAWTELGKGGKGSPDKIVISHSTDGGQTWTKPKQLSPANPVGRSGAAVKADNGNVWVAWQGQAEQHIAISTDCGKHFDKHIIVATVNPVTSPYPGASFRVNSFPSLAVGPDGTTLYLAWADRTNGHSVIKVAKSTTKGLTWFPPVVAGDVPKFPSDACQFGTPPKCVPASAFFPAIDVDPTSSSIVNLGFLALEDCLQGTPPCTTPGADVVHYAMFPRQSTDGGNTWDNPVKRAYGNSPKGDDPDASSTDDLKFQFLGDYITAVSVPAVTGISRGKRRFLVAWTDTGSGFPPAETCAAVDAFRAGGPKPNVIASCSPNFGNTDIQLTEAFTYTVH